MEVLEIMVGIHRESWKSYSLVRQPDGSLVVPEPSPLHTMLLREVGGEDTYKRPPLDLRTRHACPAYFSRRVDDSKPQQKVRAQEFRGLETCCSDRRYRPPVLGLPGSRKCVFQLDALGFGRSLVDYQDIRNSQRCDHAARVKAKYVLMRFQGLDTTFAEA